MPHKSYDPFITGDNDILERLNDGLRANDAMRADGASLEEGDVHGHALDEIRDEEDASFRSDSWRTMSTGLSFHDVVFPFVLVPDIINTGHWCFQIMNVPVFDEPFLFQARDLGTDGCDVRYYEEGSASFTTDYQFTHFLGV
jgi:hypothetical protein